MRNDLFLLFAAACLAAAAGCSGRQSAPAGFEHIAGRNLTQEPIRWLDEQEFRKVAERHARAAWAAQQVHGQVSGDYENGFVEGFVDYLDAGGNGEPPVVPPFRYRLTRFKTPEGHKATEDWFAGFRHGAAVARASGLRELILVPLSAPIASPPEPQLTAPLSPDSYRRGEAPARLPAPKPAGPTLPPIEVLPSPYREGPDNGNAEPLPPPRNIRLPPLPIIQPPASSPPAPATRVRLVGGVP
jgi:hypothetical protein